MNATTRFVQVCVSYNWLRTGHALALLVAVSCPAVEMASADVATNTHVVVCNEEAQQAVRFRTAFPTSKDETQAADARRIIVQIPGPTNPEGTILRSQDPQLDGMNAEGAKVAVYRAAYRVCMRKSGF